MFNMRYNQQASSKADSFWSINRGVAQFGRVLGLGPRCRRFESCHLDQSECSYGHSDFLYQERYPIPQRKGHWTQPLLSNLLSNQKYIDCIVNFYDFFLVQEEKSSRSNADGYTHQRKAAWYNSQRVLIGLLFCAECGQSCAAQSRQITWKLIAIWIFWRTFSEMEDSRSL